jgi:hypothetical protein
MMKRVLNKNCRDDDGLRDITLNATCKKLEVM